MMQTILPMGVSLARGPLPAKAPHRAFDKPHPPVSGAAHGERIEQGQRVDRRGGRRLGHLPPGPPDAGTGHCPYRPHHRRARYPHRPRDPVGDGRLGAWRPYRLCRARGHTRPARRDRRARAAKDGRSHDARQRPRDAGRAIRALRRDHGGLRARFRHPVPRPLLRHLSRHRPCRLRPARAGAHPPVRRVPPPPERFRSRADARDPRASGQFPEQPDRRGLWPRHAATAGAVRARSRPLAHLRRGLRHAALVRPASEPPRAGRHDGHARAHARHRLHVQVPRHDRQPHRLARRPRGRHRPHRRPVDPHDLRRAGLHPGCGAARPVPRAGVRGAGGRAVPPPPRRLPRPSRRAAQRGRDRVGRRDVPDARHPQHAPVGHRFRQAPPRPPPHRRHARREFRARGGGASAPCPHPPDAELLAALDTIIAFTKEQTP